MHTAVTFHLVDAALMCIDNMDFPVRVLDADLPSVDVQMLYEIWSLSRCALHLR